MYAALKYKYQNQKLGFSFAEDRSPSTTFGNGINLTEIAESLPWGFLIQLFLAAGVIQSLFGLKWKQAGTCFLAMLITLMLSVILNWIAY